ncbi:uncharacterized protein I303_106047 [Kwoniella dejecticola CBS 10117]|uniref:Uncharacterized protein n=1 Tax=Kwoniella dejecticola CBS 10117 TaxID=1296121 RepID=A0A1A6A146_9TREE|nr:uncharacterized protein I303_06068 [Kwoniella dejecticola CBS 10117]OBR83786.1 hypothetical protein I303_06068 [Kwoniella dejecticola CBS 10117]
MPEIQTFKSTEEAATGLIRTVNSTLQGTPDQVTVTFYKFPGDSRTDPRSYDISPWASPPGDGGYTALGASTRDTGAGWFRLPYGCDDLA